MNALSLTSAIGWTSLMNGLTGSSAAKSKYQDLLPYQKAMDSDGDLMKSTRNYLIKLMRDKRLPPWAVGQAMAHESIRRAFDGD